MSKFLSLLTIMIADNIYNNKESESTRVSYPIASNRYVINVTDKDKS